MNDYMPIDGRPLGVAMGTRPLDLNEWLEIDDQRVAVLEEKDRLLATRRDEVLAHLPAGRPGAEETLDLLIEHLPIRFPDVYGARPDGLTDRQRGIVVRRDAGHPIVVAGRLVQEDLCIMTRTDDGRWVLSAASLCFPSRWRLADKIGRDLGDIHGPVPYTPRPSAPVDRFFERITPDNPVWRTNWHLLDDAALFSRRHRDLQDRMDLDDRDVGVPCTSASSGRRCAPCRPAVRSCSRFARTCGPCVTWRPCDRVPSPNSRTRSRRRREHPLPTMDGRRCSTRRWRGCGRGQRRAPSKSRPASR
jgi:hypothetical protein